LLDGRALPKDLPPAARNLLGRLSCDLVEPEDFDPAWLSSLKDDPHQGQIRPELVALVDRMLKCDSTQHLAI
jgi:hypothetical protein